MYQFLKNSIAYHRNRPLIVPRNISQVRVEDFSTQLVKYEKNASEAVPESEAIRFYMLNDAFAKLSQKRDPHEPLSVRENALASMYIEQSQDMALRAIFYTALIITREARHLMSGNFKTKLTDTHGKVFRDFIHSICGQDEEGAVNMLRYTPPSMRLGSYVNGIADVFSQGIFHTSYGGDPWANVARTLGRMIHGETSVETFLDTVWTLCHNGGPIFNKGMLYTCYNKAHLMKILDVQRSGQIPQLVGNEEIYPTYLNQAVKEAYLLAFEVLGESFAGHVDWFAVEKLGAKNGYSAEKQAQEKKHGKPQSAVSEKGKFYVLPGVAATIVKRAA